ncbi:enoyl-CoA hydratase-related protein [Gammaproteobacteria bacterium]|nr:enoyl-CoA hydratase-related protein [Gammaproteobacteria bacterium]
MNFKTILFEESDSLAIIHLNRPKKLNAFNQAMLHDLLKALDYVDSQDSIKALIITASGKAFCAGADLSSGKNTFNSEFDNSESYEENFNRDSGGILTLRMFRCLKPILVACNGFAVGVGATLQLAADIRVSSTSAKFSFPFAKRGIAPDACSSWFLPKIVGISKALEWSYSGELIDAEIAYKYGLTSYLVKPEELMDTTKSLAYKLTKDSSSVSIALTRQMMWSLSSSLSPDEAHEIDSQVIASRGISKDALEGVMSFLEKRDPNFSNKISSDMPSIYPWKKSKFE